MDVIRIEELGISEDLLQKEAFPLHSAYKRSLNSADCLGHSKHYHDEWLTLNLSVECFLKYVYHLMYPLLLDTKSALNSETDKAIRPFFYHQNQIKIGVPPHTKNFGHEVAILLQFIGLVSNANEDISFRAMREEIPTQSKWIEERYSLEKNDRYSAKYSDYKSTFDGLLGGKFEGLR